VQRSPRDIDVMRPAANLSCFAVASGKAEPDTISVRV
jgi:hypothetical protein